MKKKLLSALLVAAMAVSTLAGCGSSTTETPAADTTTEAADTDAAADTTDDAAEATDTEVASGDKVNINIYRASYNVAQPDCLRWASRLVTERTSSGRYQRVHR